MTDEQPDWNREKFIKYWEPGKRLLKCIRDYQKYDGNRNVFILFLQKLCVIRYRFWSIVTGAEIDLKCKIGGGLLLPHPNGIVIHPLSEIGNNCLIFHQVTLRDKVIIGDHVDIGAGVKIIGPLSIGHNVVIGANAVVTRDVPSNTVMVGIPARPIKRKIE